MKPQNQSPPPDANLSNDSEHSRYELHLGGELAAYALYRQEHGAVRFTHTVVGPQHERQGLGSRLAAYALDDVRRRGMKALPDCSFIADYIQRHGKEYGDMVAP